MSVMTKEGFSALRLSYLILVAGIGVAAFLVGGTYFWWQTEKKNNAQSQRRLNDAQMRLANAEQQRDDLRDSEDTYLALEGRGVFVAERRLDLLDAMEALRARHGIISLEYQVSAQRPLKLAGGTSITAIEVLGSRVQLKATSLHDGDMLAFLDEFSRMQRGIFQIERCALGRNTRSGTVALPPPAAVVAATPRNADVPAAPPPILAPAIEADCALEWITLVDKRTPTVAVAQPTKTP
ncbi:MAG: hypothetical protein ACK5YU_01890 [Burkholderiales bacterium]|jgi:hypothetical protein|nr:hypothetical protein [Betaproteobacteria bacterium]